MKQPSPTERAATNRRIRECLGLLYRPITEQERQEAAKALGVEHMLPEPQGELEISRG